MITDYSGTILALVVGWLLSEGSHLLRYRSQRQQAVRVCLAELLEIRHRVIGNQFFFERMEAHFSLSASQLIQVRNMMPKPIQNDPEASKRLNGAIDELARYAPFLAYRLRGKDIVGTIESAFNPEEPQDDEIAQHLLKAQRDFRAGILPELTRAVTATAWQSSWLDWARACKRVWWNPQISDEVRKMTDEALSAIRDQMKPED